MSWIGSELSSGWNAVKGAANKAVKTVEDALEHADVTAAAQQPKARTDQLDQSAQVEEARARTHSLDDLVAKVRGGNSHGDGAIEGGRVYERISDSTNMTDTSLDFEVDDEGMKDVLGAMTPERRAQYDRLADLVKDNPRALQALQVHAMSGNVDKQDMVNHRDLLSILAEASESQMAPGIDKKRFVSQLLIEAENPVAISQKGRATCGATVAQQLLAEKNPAEYARIAVGLASSQGSVRLQNGDTIRRTSDWAADDRFVDKNGQAQGNQRSLVGKLMQPALMNYASQGFEHYDNNRDAFIDGLSGQNHGTGLYTQQESKVLQGLTGASGADFKKVDAQTMQNMQEALARGENNVVVLLRTGTGGRDQNHYVNVTSVSGGKVNYINPWGQRESMPVKDFQSKILGTATTRVDSAQPMMPEATAAAAHREEQARAERLRPPAPPPPPPPPPKPAPGLIDRTITWVENLF